MNKLNIKNNLRDTCRKFNHRNFRGNEFEAFLKNALQQDKELEYWKAKSAQEVKEVAYGI